LVVLCATAIAQRSTEIPKGITKRNWFLNQ